MDDDNQTAAHNNTRKKKRRFKRKYLQPQPKKTRRRRNRTNSESSFENDLNRAVLEGWNGIVKNISGNPVSKTEEMLFSKGKKFCPVELDPPIIRMQNELNGFFRTLRIKWIFYEKPDMRSELETKFYTKSTWNPPKAGVEIEQFIKHIQTRFDRWKPPQWIKDNLSKEERNFLKNIKSNSEIVYMKSNLLI